MDFYNTSHIHPKRVLVAMSGGVDSSVAAAICAEAGAEVIGVSMQLYDASGRSEHGDCCSPEDFEDARSVAQAMGFPHYVVNLQDRFAREVIDDFISEYRIGRTPNPCIRCNDALKFDALRIKAMELECDAVATGHYARISAAGPRLDLRTGIDMDRDQTYFLFTLTQTQMRQVMFPVGEMTKTQVREKAASFGLRVSDKAESREVCFVPNDDYIAFLESRIPESARVGKILDQLGNVLGEHQGVHRYTIGQRRGLGIAHPHPLYVTGIHPESGDIVVGAYDDLLSPGLIARRMNWIDGTPPQSGTPALVKIRYQHSGQQAKLFPREDGGCEIRFENPVRAIAPGQAAVAYDQDRVIGGGWIERALC